jgi:hypothetical protein
MDPLITGQTCPLRYVAEKRNSTGVATANVKCEIYNLTQALWWTGEEWGAQTELAATQRVGGAWFYDLPGGALVAGDVIEWAFYSDPDATVWCYDGGEVLPAGGVATSTDVASILAAIAGAGGSGSVRTVIHVQDPDGNPVAGIGVVAQGDNGGLGVTLNAGEVVLMLNPDTYEVDLYGTAAYSLGNPHTVVVTVAATHTIVITPVTIPAPADPTLCACYVNISDGDGPLGVDDNEVGLGWIWVRSIGTPEFPAALVNNGPALVPPPVANTVAGYASVDLPQGAMVTLTVGVGPQQVPTVSKTMTLTIPAQGTLNLDGDLTAYLVS